MGRRHKGLYDTINNSLHFQLGLALASVGVITSLVAQHMYFLPTYAFIAQDFTFDYSDTRDSKSCAQERGGSRPLQGIILRMLIE